MAQEQKKKEVHRPQRSFLQRTFGSEEFSPEILAAIEIARRENPDLAPVEPYGFLSKIFSRGEQGYTSPSRNIYLDPKMLQGQSVQDIADTLTHEQEHVRQMRSRNNNPVTEFLSQVFSGSEPYHQREDELAAFQAEKNRRNKMNRMQTATPSFLTGEFRNPSDVRLPKR